MTSLPALFSGSGQTVVEGSVIWLYCKASSTSPTLTVTWNKDNTEIVEDVPHNYFHKEVNLWQFHCLPTGGGQLAGV